MARIDTRTGFFGLVRRLVEAWAVLGGGVLLAVVCMSVWSIAASALIGRPVPGDFEMVEVGVAIAAFAFLPYCELTGATVSADTFTSRASPRTIAGFTLFAAIIALGFSLLMLWRMSAGMQDYMKYEETTAILQYPLWVSFIPILFSLALLALSALISLLDAIAGTRGYVHG